MSDRFKFRVWNKAAEKFVERFILSPNDGICIISDKGKAYVKGNPNYILMQCTGLKDKNGKLIYEGDIIKCSYGFEYYIGVVVWDKQCIQFSMSVDKELYSFNQRSEYDKTEVIGNIYENKELLNE